MLRRERKKVKREINGADSAQGENTMCKGRTAYGEMRGTKDKEKNQRLRGEIKGAHSAKGRNQMHGGGHKM